MGIRRLVLFKGTSLEGGWGKQEKPGYILGGNSSSTKQKGINMD